MADIPKTLIGTNNVPTITNGVPLYEHFHFPDGWSTHFDSQWWDTREKWDAHILEGKLASRFAWNLEFGLAGPDWAGRMEVEGTASKDTFRLDILNDAFRGGILLGANFNIQFGLQLQSYRYVEHHQVWPPKMWFTKEWKDLFHHETDFNFDLLKGLFELASFAHSIGKIIPFIRKILVFVPSAKPNLIAGNSGIKDYIEDPGDILSWVWEGLTLSPDLQMEWDLIEIAESLGTDAADAFPPIGTVAELLQTVAKIAFGWLMPKLATGPVVGVAMEVHLKISGLTGYTANGDTITTENIRGEGASLVADIKDGAQHVSNIDALGVDFTHRAGISFELGWHTKISWLKVFSKDVVKKKQASDFGMEIPVSEQYRYELKNKVGSTSDESHIDITMEDSWVFGG